jgi:hypothetical protein
MQSHASHHGRANSAALRLRLLLLVLQQQLLPAAVQGCC